MTTELYGDIMCNNHLSSSKEDIFKANEIFFLPLHNTKFLVLKFKEKRKPTEEAIKENKILLVFYRY